MRKINLTMQLKNILIALSFVVVFGGIHAQTAKLSGLVTDAANGEPLLSATVKIGLLGTITDFDGSYLIQLSAGTHTVEVSYVGFETVTQTVDLKAGEDRRLDFQLQENQTLLQTATVTSGKYERALGEVTVSLEVIRQSLLESINTTSIDDALQKVPGVDIIDGQANIRGGSGFSYGAGSRVLLLIDDMPILQADAGYPNWSDVPVENIDRIEVVKGAASALYGSSALNGIINIRTAYATSKPVTKISGFYTFYDKPADKKQVWYDDYQPFEYGFSASHKQKIDRLDIVLGAFQLYRRSYLRSTNSDYFRFNAGARYRLTDKLAIGFNSNFNPGNSEDFFFWKSLDSLFVGSDNTLSTHERFRFNIDPFITYFDPAGNRHRLQGRYYSIDNKNDNNGADQSNRSQTVYAEYQFQRNWAGLDLVSTAGVVFTGNSVTAPLYGDTVFSIKNVAAYAQLEKKFFKRLNTSLGFRFEHNTLETPEIFGCRQDIFTGKIICDTIQNGRVIESKPVWRFGLNYQLAEGTFLRASWGQGYRFPTIAESFITTTFGGVPVSPNPQLRSETGWSAELGIKQGFRLGTFDGFLDIAAFRSDYKDMMEFNLVDFFPTGFKSLNVGGTEIVGMEMTIAGRGNFFGWPTNILAGYTYLNPQFKQFDTTPLGAGETPTEGQRNALNSSSDENILKYRFRHTLKFDIESSYKRYALGFAANYNSFMEAVDEVFESLIVPGLRQYRQDNNTGIVILSARTSVSFWQEKAKLSLIVNNLDNKMYSIRAGIMDPPRNYTLRVDWKF